MEPFYLVNTGLKGVGHRLGEWLGKKGCVVLDLLENSVKVLSIEAKALEITEDT